VDTRSRNLIRIWVRKYEEGAFDDEALAADMIQEYEARIAALERLVGKQARNHPPKRNFVLGEGCAILSRRIVAISAGPETRQAAHFAGRRGNVLQRPSRRCRA
jgi:hypothetical protein